MDSATSGPQTDDRAGVHPIALGARGFSRPSAASEQAPLPCVASAAGWQLRTPVLAPSRRLPTPDDAQDPLDLLRPSVERPETPMHLPAFRVGSPVYGPPALPGLSEIASPPPPPEASQGLPGLTGWKPTPPAPATTPRPAMPVDRLLALISVLALSMICVLVMMLCWR